MNNDNLICPITKLIFNDPVVADDGYVYEFLAITDWLKENSRSPLTGESISGRLMRVQTIKDMVTNFLNNNPEFKKEQFLFKKPFYLFKSQFIELLKEKNEEKMMEYTAFCLTHEMNKATLFDYICKTCSNEVIKHIINSSIDFDVEDHRGLRPIHIACRYSNPEIINYLIDKDVDLNCEDTNGNCPLNYVLLYNYNRDIVKKMIGKGVKINYHNANQQLPIHYIISKGDIDMFDFFLSHGAIMPENLVAFTFKNSHNCEFIKYVIDLGLNIDEDEFMYELLIYKNENLRKDEKQNLVYYYLYKLQTIPIIDEEYADNMSEGDVKDDMDEKYN